MACDFPIPAYRSAEKGPSGKRQLVFNPKHAVDPQTGRIDIPCGQCMGCKLDRASQWAVRMMHEASVHEFNSFLTLTYDAATVPQDYSLKLEHAQGFLKRLRRHAEFHYKGLRLRFYLAGEYGDDFGRPHYHAAIFGFDFPDKSLFKRNHLDQPIFVSDTLTRLWSHGHASTAALDYESAAYIARYCTKKVTGKKAPDHYYRVSPVDGQAYQVRPEFATMSRRPGLGAAWLQRFKSDVFPSGFVVVNGTPQAPPRFYVNRLSAEEQQALKRQSKRRALRHKADNTDARRYVRAQVRDARIKSLKRNYSGE